MSGCERTKGLGGCLRSTGTTAYRQSFIFDWLGNRATMTEHDTADAVPATRIVDKAGFFHAGRDPQAVDEQLLYDRLLNEFPAWLADARAAGVIP